MILYCSRALLSLNQEHIQFIWRHYVHPSDSTVMSCMTPDKLHNICKPQFPHWYSGGDNVIGKTKGDCA